MTPLSITTWRWRRADGTELFTAEHVNILRAMLERHLHLPFKLHCVTDNPTGIDSDVHIIPLEWYTDTPRCRRRMVQYAEWWRHFVGPRFLNLDLDVVITDDVTEMFSSTEPLKFWRVGYAGVYSGAVQLMDTGVLHALYEVFAMAPESFPSVASPRGVGSDQAMLNHFLRVAGITPAAWGEPDGIFTFFGNGYEKYAHLGVSPASERLPDGCRMVIMGSDDLRYLKELPCLNQHYHR